MLSTRAKKSLESEIKRLEKRRDKFLAEAKDAAVMAEQVEGGIARVRDLIEKSAAPDLGV